MSFTTTSLKPTHQAFSATALLSALTTSPLVIAHVPAYVSMFDVAEVVTDARVLDLTDPVVRDAVDWDPLAFLDGSARCVIFAHSHLLPRLPHVLRESLDPTSHPGACLLLSAVDPAAHSGDATATVTLRSVSSAADPDLPGIVPLLRESRELESVRSEWGRTDYIDRVLHGAVPSAAGLDVDRRARWWGDTRDALVEAARSIIKVGGGERLPDLLAQIAARPGAELVRAQLGVATGVPASSVTLYMKALVATGALELLPAWTPGVTSREVVKPVMHPCDTAAAVTWAGWTSDQVSAVSPTSPLRGLLLTAVVGELLTRNTQHEPYALHHYRDRAGVAVPVVAVMPDSNIVAFDVAATSAPRDDAFTPLRTLREAVGPRLTHSFLLTLQNHGRRVDDSLWSLPLSTVWQMG